MRISDWSSDVCSSDLVVHDHRVCRGAQQFDPLRCDQRVVVAQRVGALVEMDAGFGAMHDDVAAGDVAPVLGAATAVTAAQAAGPAAADGVSEATLDAVAQPAAPNSMCDEVFYER